MSGNEVLQLLYTERSTCCASHIGLNFMAAWDQRDSPSLDKWSHGRGILAHAPLTYIQVSVSLSLSTNIVEKCICTWDSKLNQPETYTLLCYTTQPQDIILHFRLTKILMLTRNIGVQEIFCLGLHGPKWEYSLPWLSLSRICFPFSVLNLRSSKVNSMVGMMWLLWTILGHQNLWSGEVLTSRWAIVIIAVTKVDPCHNPRPMVSCGLNRLIITPLCHFLRKISSEMTTNLIVISSVLTKLTRFEQKSAHEFQLLTQKKNAVWRGVTVLHYSFLCPSKTK
jgi:hypothetical protein